ncbi:MAG: EFR1 family ferrodoxin [Spirochaetales bacterium]|nr:EFR1 family ferrodoxin [Spirochaetales bacterium]
MQFVLFYFSGTGNTELISKELKRRLESDQHEVELICVEDRERVRSVSFEGKVLGIGFPVYKFSYPDIMEDLLQQIKKRSADNRYFLFSTYARFTSESFLDFSRSLRSSSCHLIAERSFKAPSCGISARLPESDYEYESVMFFEDDIKASLDSFVEEILSSLEARDIRIRHNHSFLNPLKLKVVKEIELTKYPELQINSDRCRSCGLCADKCPEQNLLKTETSIDILDKYGCLHCLRCMNHCPANAVCFGELTQGENRYTFSLRDRLFEKALSGHKEKHWAKFDDVTKQWRKNTLRYWRRHRRNPEL